MNIKEMLKAHSEWLEDSTKGQRADLTRADLIGANLTGANLTRANLSYRDLTEANLTGANLYQAYLIGANLTNADLTSANLTGAYLCQANLTGVVGKNIITYSSGERHQLIYVDGYIRIGCEYHSLEEWVQIGREIGIKNNYSEKDINSYMRFIETLNKGE